MPHNGQALSTPVTMVRRSAGDFSHDVLPLPLTTFDRHFLSEDSPSYPAQFFCRLRFSGKLAQDALITALRAALVRHPLLGAVAHEAKGQPPQWVEGPDPLLDLQWLEQEPTDAFPPARRLNIRTRPGLSVTAVSGSDRSDLILQFHHSACDGLGALDFTTDVLSAYANAVLGNQRYQFKPLDPQRLRGREVLPLSGWPLVRWGMRRLPSAFSLVSFARRNPAPVVPHRPKLDAEAPASGFPEGCVHHFSREESIALAAMARGSETSSTGLLVRDLFRAIHTWQKQNGHPDRAWLRLMLPINMRTTADRQTPAANIVSTMFLDCRPARESDPDALLARINRLLETIKHDHLGMAWILSMRLLHRTVPRAWDKIRRSRRKCLFSTLLTNLGPVLASSPLPRRDRHLVVGDMTLEDFEFLPVTRPLQCMGVAVSTYAGRTSLSMRYDSRVLSEAAASELLDVYVRTLRESMRAT
jgi:hypothetical protein